MMTLFIHILILFLFQLSDTLAQTQCVVIESGGDPIEDHQDCVKKCTYDKMKDDDVSGIPLEDCQKCCTDKMRNVLSQAHGLDSTFDIDIIDRTFNETCCEERGVPYECMANCKDARGPIYEGYRMGKLQSRCTKYNHIIENCIITVRKDSEGPKGCCKAMTAPCMACSVGKTVKEFCKSHPHAIGCKDVQPKPEGRQKEGERCGYIFEMCEEGLHCVFPNNKPGRQWGIKTGTCRKTESENCCRANTAECLACNAGQKVEMFCRLHPEIEECRDDFSKFWCPLMSCYECNDTMVQEFCSKTCGSCILSDPYLPEPYLPKPYLPDCHNTAGAVCKKPGSNIGDCCPEGMSCDIDEGTGWGKCKAKGEMCHKEHEACGFQAISPPKWPMHNTKDKRNHGECCKGYKCSNQMLGGVGKCVKDSKCKGNLVYYDFNHGHCKPCDDQCVRGKVVPTICTMDCKNGCGCPKGLIMSSGDETKCITRDDCRKRDSKCEGNLEYYECKPCYEVCGKGKQICDRRCRPGCGCPEGMIRSAKDDSKCVKRENCDRGDVCSEICTREHFPVCGSDGKTYSNECELRNAKCKDKPYLEISYPGKCDDEDGNSFAYCDRKMCGAKCKEQGVSGKCDGNGDCIPWFEEPMCDTLQEVRPALCELKSEAGPCRAAFQMYFFNKKSGNCEKFTWGGCEGNENNFEKIEDCQNTCLAERVFW